jgi:hypothetical protein
MAINTSNISHSKTKKEDEGWLNYLNTGQGGIVKISQGPQGVPNNPGQGTAAGRTPPRSPCAGKPPGSCGGKSNVTITMPDAPDSNVDTGMGIMGAAKTLGDIGKNVFDDKAKGLEGLITNITGGGRDIESSRKKKRTISDLFGLNVGQSKYGTTV